jgi:23S rRNA (guanosine2251-2'-O)-methyltransferase
MKRLLLGPHAVAEGLRATAARVAVVYSEEDPREAVAQVLRLARDRKVRCETRSRRELDALARGDRHQGVLAITGDFPYLDLEALLAHAGERPLLVALDQVTDPQNFGAILRSAVALGAAGVITLRDRACPVTDAVVRASAGASELVRLARVTNLARTLGELRDRDMQVAGLDSEATTALADLPYPSEGRVLVVGSEGTGLRRLVREQCDALTCIPQAGALQSLNAAVAAGIAIYESLRQRRLHDET